MTKKYISFPANISCFPRRLENVVNVTLFVFQDVLKTFWRRIQDVFAIRLPKMPSRRLQDVFARRIAIMSSRRLQDVLEDKKMLHWRRLEDVLKTSSVRLHQDECLLGLLTTSYYLKIPSICAVFNSYKLISF